MHFQTKISQITMYFQSKNTKNDAFSKYICLIREKVVTFRMVKLNMLLSIFLITK